MSELMKRIANSLTKETLRKKKKAQMALENEPAVEENKPARCLDSLYEALAEGDCEDAKEYLAQVVRELGLVDQVSFDIAEDDSEEDSDEAEDSDETTAEMGESDDEDRDAAMFKTSKY